KVITEVWNMGPVNKKVAPAGKFADVLPKPGDAVTFDETVINQRLGAWTEKVNQASGQCRRRRWPARSTACRRRPGQALRRGPPHRRREPGSAAGRAADPAR